MKRDSPGGSGPPVGDDPLATFPWRVFLDSSTLQTLQDFGEAIYDGGDPQDQPAISKLSNGMANIEALRNIMLVGQRAPFEFAISENSIREVRAKGDPRYLQWAFEIVAFWEERLRQYRDRPFTGIGIRNSALLSEGKFGYLSNEDKLLIRDAIQLECGAFMTMEGKLPRNASHLERELHLKVVQPQAYWEMLRPLAALFV